jgi:hypothetical protein
MLEYWFMRDLGAPGQSKRTSNLLSLHGADILAHGFVAITTVSASLPAAPGQTQWVIYRNTLPMRAVVGGAGTTAAADSMFLPMITDADFSNLSSINPGDVMSIIKG